MSSSQAQDIKQVIADYRAGVIGLGPSLTLDERREAADAIGVWATPIDDVSRTAVELGGRAGTEYTHDSIEPGLVVLYLHGGGYVMSSLYSHDRLMAHLSKRTKTRVYGLDFRRAPENPYPAALEDTLAAYREVLGLGYHHDQIVLVGDSAGGGLVLAAMAALREQGEPLPGGGITLSPWLDLALTGESIEKLAAKDPWTTRVALATFGGYYAGDTPLDHPGVSPLYMDFAGLPPLLMHVSSTEILFDDSNRARDSAIAAGVDVEFSSWDDVPHVFQLFAGNLPEADESLDAIAEWLHRKVRRS